jgi:L-fuconate dehydratase
MFDYVAVSGTMDNRTLEYVDHLHEHFINPVQMRKGRYLAPTQPGYSIEMFPGSRDDHIFPDGPVWQKLREEGK